VNGNTSSRKWNTAALGRDEFMNHIMDKTREMVERIKTGELPEAAFSTLKTPCPRCGGVIQEGYKKFQCKSCDYSLWKVVASRQWESAEMDELLKKRHRPACRASAARWGAPSRP
jgi:DNA topoisomerase-3